MEEIWKDIKFTDTDGKEYDYTGYYQVSNLGNVRSLDRIDGSGHKLKGRMLKQSMVREYKHLGLTKDGITKKFRVHRLVAHMFIENPNGLPIVNHKDENKENNHVDNLEWCDHEYNMNYGTRSERASNKLKGRVFTEEWKQKIRDNHTDLSGDKNPRAKKVICIETGQVFTTIKEAQEWCKGSVRQCLCGACKTAGGYHWQYVDDTL